MCVCGSDPACSSGIATSAQWLQVNMGGFAYLATFQDIQTIYSNFSAVRYDALHFLSLHLFSCGVGFPSVITTTVTDNMCVCICRWKPCHSSRSDS